MLYFLIGLILGTILTEAITEVVVKSEIFMPIRKVFFDLGKNNIFFKWLHDLLDCGYCFSVWAGTLSSFIIFYNKLPVLWVFIIGIILHRLSNVFHAITDKIKDKGL